MKRKKLFELLITIVLLVVFGVIYQQLLGKTRDSFEGIDWIWRLGVFPLCVTGIVYSVFRILFSFAIWETNKKVCCVFLRMVLSIYILYVLILVYTLFVLLVDDRGLSGYHHIWFYEVLRIVFTVGGSRLQEGVSCLFGILGAFGVTGVQRGK